MVRDAPVWTISGGNCPEHRGSYPQIDIIHRLKFKFS